MPGTSQDGTFVPNVAYEELCLGSSKCVNKILFWVCTSLGLLEFLPPDPTSARSMENFLLTFVGSLELPTMQLLKMHLEIFCFIKILFPNNFQSITNSLQTLLSLHRFDVAESHHSSFRLYGCISLKHIHGDVCAKRQMVLSQDVTCKLKSHFPWGEYLKKTLKGCFQYKYLVISNCSSCSYEDFK